MPTEIQKQLDTSELLDDIRFINEANKNEIKRIRSHIRQRIEEENLTGNGADVVANEVSNLLGQLSAKVNLTEKMIRKFESSQQIEPKTRAKKETTDLEFGVAQIVDNQNLLPIEKSADGVSFCWTGVDPEIRFEFALDRGERLGLRIHLHAIIKPEYFRQLKMFIDGARVSHKFYLEDRSHVISCNLSASRKTSQTEIKIVLPATHSPRELGISNDGRKLGIAISQIRFGKPENRFVLLLKRLRMRK